MLLRPDIFNSLGLQNTTNKLFDNSVFLDWRTTYDNYKNSLLFEASDRLFSSQQNIKTSIGDCWNSYFPWKSRSSNERREFDDSFINFLRISYCRPRDIINIISFLKNLPTTDKSGNVFSERSFHSDDFKNIYSEYLLGGIKDQLSFYYSKQDYQLFVKFFANLNGKSEFSYKDYTEAYNVFCKNYVKGLHLPEFLESNHIFLQFLYDTNIICYIDYSETQQFFRYCYRERSLANISPKVKIGAIYRVHTGLHKALNVGGQEIIH